jgi:hypothetical protein
MPKRKWPLFHNLLFFCIFNNLAAARVSPCASVSCSRIRIGVAIGQPRNDTAACSRRYEERHRAPLEYIKDRLHISQPRRPRPGGDLPNSCQDGTAARSSCRLAATPVSRLGASPDSTSASYRFGERILNGGREISFCASCPTLGKLPLISSPRHDVPLSVTTNGRVRSQSNSRRLASRHFRGINDNSLRAAPHLFHGYL